MGTGVGTSLSSIVRGFVGAASHSGDATERDRNRARSTAKLIIAFCWGVGNRTDSGNEGTFAALD